MQEGAKRLKQRLEGFPRVPLSLTPTPCHRLPYLSQHFGREVYCKREDLTGFGFGGNKTRKLEWLIAEALGQKCDTLVTSGGIQSNFCRITAAAAAHSGLSAHLVLGGVAPSAPTGNLILNDLLGATTHFMGSSDWTFDQMEDKSLDLAAELRSMGRKVFHIPVGGSIAIGAVAYSLVLLEIMADQEKLGLEFDCIVHATGSGGTQAGLLAGKSIAEWKGDILGVSVGMDAQSMASKVAQLADETAHLLGGNVKTEDVRIEDDHIGPGYAVPTDGGKRAIKLFARKEGIFLDHVYTGKAADALIDWLKQDRIKGKNLLFIHTGGTPELFA